MFSLYVCRIHMGCPNRNCIFKFCKKDDFMKNTTNLFIGRYLKKKICNPLAFKQNFILSNSRQTTP